MIIKVINNDTIDRTWCGQQILAGGNYTLQAVDVMVWANNDAVLSDIAAGTLIINDGTANIIGISNQIDYLKGKSPQSISGAVTVTAQPDPAPFATPTYRTKLNATPETITIAPGADEDITFKLLAERYVSGGSIIVKNAQLGDYIVAEVEDTDGVIPVPYRTAVSEAYPVISTYIEKCFIEVQGEYTVMKINTYPLTAKISAGLYLCVHYYAINNGTTRELAVNYNLTKKL